MNTENRLAGRKVLLIAPRTFGYEGEITRSLEGMGATVHYYNDRPFSDNLRKVLLRLIPILLKANVTSYFKNIISETEEIEFDLVFCIKMECFPRAVFEELRKRQPTARFVFYTWDSFENNPNSKTVLDLFDRKYSFDKRDAESHGLMHRPLFYLPEYSRLKGTDFIYDAAFIGSVHYRRYRFVKQVVATYSDRFRLFIYLFVPSKWLFFARKFLLFPWYGRTRLSEFQFAPLTKEQILDVLARARCVIDYSHHKQDGLTMRVIEAVGAGKKIITTNKSIAEYDFFRPENILVVDEHAPVIPDEFLQQPYKDIPHAIYARYSIEGWLEDVLLRSASEAAASSLSCRTYT